MKPSSAPRNYILVALILLASVLTFFVVQSFLIPVALAAFFGIALYPLYRWFLHKTKGRKAVSALCTELVAVLAILIPLSILGSRLLEEAGRIGSYFSSPDNITALSLKAQAIASRFGANIPGAQAYITHFTVGTNQLVQGTFQFLVNNSGYAFIATFTFLLSLFLFLITLFYLLKDSSQLLPRLSHLSPLGSQETAQISHRIITTVNSIVRGSILVAIIQSIVASVGFTLFGVPNALIWGLSTGIASLIPGVGTPGVYFSTTAYLFITGHTLLGIGMLLWSISAIVIVDNIIGPKLVGGRAEIHPILILISVLGGLSFFGASGIFLGPLTVSILIGLLEIYAPEAKAE
jgi:predicted PurR-regulated permease PerM